MKNYSFMLFLIFLTSCFGEDRFLIIQDKYNYDLKDYHLDTKFRMDSLYKLDRRYFVFNYKDNSRIFDSLVINLVCKSLNDSLLVSYVYFDFQDMGWQGGRYEEGDVLSADFTTPLVYFYWDITQPNVIVTKWGEFNEEKQIIEFDCDLKQEYDKYIQNE